MDMASADNLIRDLSLILVTRNVTTNNGGYNNLLRGSTVAPLGGFFCIHCSTTPVPNWIDILLKVSVVVLCPINLLTSHSLKHVLVVF